MTIAAEVVVTGRHGERRRPNAAQLRAARVDAGLSQRELGRRLAARLGDGYEAELAKVVCRAERGTYRTLDPAVWDAIVAELDARRSAH